MNFCLFGNVLEHSDSTNDEIYLKKEEMLP
jgi:hypothetical protein